MAGKMHANEADIDVPLVRRLLAGQFPEWAELAIRQCSSTGTVNAMYRLGDDMVVRLPRVEWALDGFDRELEWLPWLAPHLPVATPGLLGKGVPGEGYPWQWCVYRWLEGTTPDICSLEAPDLLARDLAAFIAALQAIDPSNGPPSDQSLALHDGPARAAIEVLSGMIDNHAVTAVWESALHAPEWDGAPVWLHGDMSPGNVLVADARLSAVIDFSAVGVGDPAGDIRVAWNLLPGEVRDSFRAALRVDDATWERARGKALAQALIHLRYFRTSNPVLAANARQVIREILADCEPVVSPRYR